MAREMHQLRDELPNAGFTSLNDCGHFIQEDDPERLAEVLKGFFES